MNQLDILGWNDNLQHAWSEMGMPQFMPARVIADYGSNYKIAAPEELTAEISGRLEYVSEPHELPKVGDWVAIQCLDNNKAIIHAVLPRNSEIGRKQPGEQFAKQVLAANVDIAFLVQALDHDFSPERLQRYLFQLSHEGVKPILILNKADKEQELESKMGALKQFDIRIVVTSATHGKGMDEISEIISPGTTAVFLGSSGVGKSTITNQLLGIEKQSTQTIREADSKGRHTTTHRELFILPNGGLVIDTPGLRELQLWGTEEDLRAVFSDIDSLAKQCKFNNCTHISEPGCAVLSALSSGELDNGRLESYFKFQKELRFLETKVDEQAAYEHRQKEKQLGKYYNQVIRGKNDRKRV